MTVRQARRIVRREYPRAVLVLNERNKVFEILLDFPDTTNRYGTAGSASATWVRAARLIRKGEMF